MSVNSREVLLAKALLEATDIGFLHLYATEQEMEDAKETAKNILAAELKEGHLTLNELDADTPNTNYWVGIVGDDFSAHISILFNSDGIAIDVWSDDGLEADESLTTMWLSKGDLS